MITKNIDPIELDDELEIETPSIEEVTDTFDGEGEEIDDDEDGFFDDEDSDESDGDEDDEDDQPVVKKPKVKKAPKVKSYKGTIIRKFPQVGAMYSTKLILIAITHKLGTTYTCEVLSSQEPSRWKVGECFKAEEIAFYSDHYQFAGFVKK